jgi:hypothetical protein
MRRKVMLCVAVLSALVLATGCSFEKQTSTARTGIEQLLLSTSVDRSMAKSDLESLAGKKVFVDVANLEAVDKGYVVESVRNRVATSGGLLVGEAKDADVVLEARSGALGIDENEFMIGIPSIPIPIPAVGTFATPEIAFFKKVDQHAISKQVLFGRDGKEGAHVLTTGPLVGTAYYNRWQILFLISFRTTDLNER